MAAIDFNDPNRPRISLDTDFPVIPVNQIAITENAEEVNLSGAEP